MSNNNTAVEITTPVEAVVAETPVVETPKAPEAKAPKIDIVTRFKADAESVKKAFQARFSAVSIKTPTEIGIACLICLIVGSLGATTINAASIAAAEKAKVQAVEEADKAVRVAKAEAGVPPTFLQSLYGVTVRPVSDAAQYSYGAAKNADGRAYGAVTSTFASGSSEAPTVKVVAPAATK
jgi:hypothetical protein